MQNGCKNQRGALIKTNTDWTGAEFIIDDTKMVASANQDESETRCYLFTVASNYECQTRYVNRVRNPKLSLGVDPNLDASNQYPLNVSDEDSYKMINKTFGPETTKLEGNFNEKALYFLRTSSYKRFGRYGNASAEPRDQTEVIIVNKDGTIDSASPIQWPWQDIHYIEKYPIDETTLTIKGGKFTTNVNHLKDWGYCNRGILVNRSNVVIDGVEHYLIGENYADPNHPMEGDPYYGFFQLKKCAYVTIKNCVMSDHKEVYKKTDNSLKTASPYDFTAEYVCGLTM